MDRQVATQAQAAFILLAAGRDAELPDRDAELRRLDAVLSRPPVGTGDRDRTREQILREAFGLTGGGG